jgi:hypothetical protein
MRCVAADDHPYAQIVCESRAPGKGAFVFGRVRWCRFLTALLLLVEAASAQAVEYGELAENNGTWVFKNTEDPVFKLMRDRGWITNESYFKVTDQTGNNWIEPADAVLNQRRELDWNRYLKTSLHLPDWIDLGL